MSPRVTIVTPELPPTPGGLADYTAHVVANWPGDVAFDFLLPRRSEEPMASFRNHRVRAVPPNRAELLASFPTSGGKVLVQYSAYGFDRVGYPRWLLDGLTDWRKQGRGSLCVMFHEIWAFWPFWNKNFLIQKIHRRAIRRLLGAADAIFTTTPSQRAYLVALAPGKTVTVLPVGSNITPGSIGPESGVAGTAVVFGSGGTRLRALRDNASGLRALAQLGRVTKLVSIGGGNTAGADADERALLATLKLRDGFEQAGPKSAADISHALSASEFGIAAHDPLSYTKSGTFMAYAAHGLNVLKDDADSSATEPGCWLTAPADLVRGLSSTELRERAEKLRAWSARVASWPQIAGAYAQALNATPTGGMHS